MNLKKIAGTAMIAGALGAASLGLGAGSAQADPDWVTRTFRGFRGRQIGFRDIGIRESIGARLGRSRNGAPGTPRPVTGKGVHTGFPVATFFSSP